MTSSKSSPKPSASASATKKKKKKKKTKKRRKRIAFADANNAEVEAIDPVAILLKYARTHPFRFRSGAQKLLQEHKAYVLNLGAHNETEDADTHDLLQTSNAKTEITEAMFVQHFKAKISPELSRCIFAMIADGAEKLPMPSTSAAGGSTHSSSNTNTDTNTADAESAAADAGVAVVVHVTQFDVIKFMEGHRSYKHVRQVTAKDADWLLTHLRNVQFADLDARELGKIELCDFYDYFEPLGLSKSRIRLMFEMLDKNGDKKISIMEFQRWRSKQTATDLQNVLNQLNAIEPEMMQRK